MSVRRQTAVGYIRVSSQGQVAGNGLDRQKDAINQYVKQHRMTLDNTFADEGVSGTIKDRDALNECMDYCQQHKIEYIIVEKIDRIARDLIVSEMLIKEITEKGLILISVLEGNVSNTDDASRSLIRHMFGAIAEYDKNLLVSKLKAARDRVRKATGHCEGSHGYLLIGQHTLDKIRRLRRKPRSQPHRKRKGYAEIADILNTEGVETLRGKKWTYHNVRYVCNL
jgi:DNA invertase Pin-like site-specific DNA recombinase